MDGRLQGSDQRHALREHRVPLSPNFAGCVRLVKQIAQYNNPPFVVVKDNQRETSEIGGTCLSYVKNEGTRDVNMQRYKGLGEMNAEPVVGHHDECQSSRTMLQWSRKISPRPNPSSPP